MEDYFKFLIITCLIISLASSFEKWTHIGGSKTRDGISVVTNPKGYSEENFPSRRKEYATWKVSDDEVMIFGGRGLDGSGNDDEDRVLGDIWSYVLGDRYQWKMVADHSVYNMSLSVWDPTNQPGRCSDFASGVLPERNVSFVFGGRTSDDGVSEKSYSGFMFYHYSRGLWRWDGRGQYDGGKISVFNTSDIRGFYDVNDPGSRFRGVTHVVNESLVALFQGSGYDTSGVSGKCSNQVWLYDYDLNQWSFFAGIDAVNQASTVSVYNLQNQYDPTQKPGTRRYLSSWKVNDDRILFFGGYGQDISQGTYGIFNDLWQWSFSRKSWAWLGGGKVDTFTPYDSNWPCQRSEAAHATLGEPGSQEFLVSGGEAEYGAFLLHDIWVFKFTDEVNGVWERILGKTVPTSPVLPEILEDNKPDLHQKVTLGSRSRFSAIGFDNKVLILMGVGLTPFDDPVGYNDKLQGDLFMYSRSDPTDVLVYLGSTPSTARGVYGELGIFSEENFPGPRINHIQFRYLDKYLVVFSGEGQDISGAIGDLNDLWLYDTDEGNWKWLSGSKHIEDEGLYEKKYEYSSNMIPCSRNSAAFSMIGEDVFAIYGGFGAYESCGGHALQDIILYDFKKNQWSWIYGTVPYECSVSSNYTSHGLEDPFNELEGRAGSILFYYEDFLYVLLGETSFGNSMAFRNSVWKFNVIDYSLVWMRGNSIDEMGLYNIAEYGTFHSDNEIGGRCNPSYWAFDDKIVVFGGNAYAERKNDIWIYSIGLNAWNFVGGKTFYDPGGRRELNDWGGVLERSNAAFFSVNELFMFCGGRNYDIANSIHNDCWMLELIDSNGDLNYTYSFQKISTNDGIDSLGVYGDLHTYDESGKTKVGGFVRSTISFFPSTGSFYLFGGEGYDSFGSRDYLNHLFEIQFGRTNCSGILEFESSVCSGRGSCIDDACTCSEPDSYYGIECELFDCFDLRMDESGVCNGGSCVAADRCDCLDGFSGDECTLVKCFGKLSNESDCCGGNGDCVATDTCECLADEGFTVYDGVTCLSSMSAGGYATIYSSSIIVVTLCVVINVTIFVIVFIIACGKRCKACCVKLNAVRKLENVEILLQEQETELLDTENNVAKIDINKELFKIQSEDVKLLQKIGEGGSDSQVFKASWNGTIVAYKLFRFSATDDTQSFESFEKEVRILSSVSHPYVLRFFGASIELPKIGILMEFAEKGDLTHFIKMYPLENKNEHVPFKKKMEIFSQVCSAMAYLHSKNIVHRDLKPDNILVTKSEDIKIMDFGLSRSLSSDKTMTAQIGTSYYIAPEVILAEKYDCRVDAFAMSFIMYEVLTEQFNPFQKTSTSVHGIEFKIANDKEFRITISEEDKKMIVHDWIVDLIKKCWNHDPKERPTFSEMDKMFAKAMKGGSFVVYMREKGKSDMEEFLIHERKLKMIKEKIAEKYDLGSKMIQKILLKQTKGSEEVDITQTEDLNDVITEDEVFINVVFEDFDSTKSIISSQMKEIETLKAKLSMLSQHGKK